MTAIKVPPLGESIVEATVSRWQKKEGEPVAVGDTLVELETDKITVEVPALASGVLGYFRLYASVTARVCSASHQRPMAAAPGSAGAVTGPLLDELRN